MFVLIGKRLKVSDMLDGKGLGINSLKNSL